MPWFRWLKQQNEQTADAVAPHAEPAEEPEAPKGAGVETTETDDTDADTSITDAEALRRKRRRGSRGGRGRKKPASSAPAAAADGDEPPAQHAGASGAGVTEGGSTPARRGKTDRGEKPERTGRKPRSSERRRKQPPRRAPLPAAERELLISIDVGEQRVAVLEDGRVAEVYLERPERRSIAGNIYLGTVDNVLPGMEAAFVEIGLEKNGFLYVDEIVVPELEGKRQGKKITDLIQRGQQVLVQAVKDPMKTKGARLTTEISLPGRFLVYVPYGEGLGVSRRLEDAERQRLKDILRELNPKHGGVIVRTAAEGASAEDVERDLVFLERLWKTIQARAKAATAPELVYQEAELPLRIVRDLFAGDFLGAHVDDDRAHKRIVSYLKKTSPHMIERVHRHKERERLFERYGVEKEIASTLDRRVDLPSGGYLIFDYAEAFTVIDVNTGRFVGSRSKTSTQRLEDTIVKNNLEAVKEVVRQLRLRDIGGIIVIDFIDMANPKNRQSVEEALRTELERDRTKTYVVEISPLGLVEMTRQNVTDGPREVMTRRCPTCAGDGIVVSDATAALAVERRLAALAAGTARTVQAYRVAVHPRVLPILAGPGGSRLAELEERTKKRFFLVEAEGHAHVDHVDVVAEGKMADLQPAAAIEEGAELEVKFVEVGLHDATAAVAKVDGMDVVVADAAKLVGKKATVTVGRVIEGFAFATIVAASAPSIPITFESEAEKPTRAPAKRRTAKAADEPAETQETVAPDEEAIADEVADEIADDDIEGALEPDADAVVPVKKKTRRGSRGGQRRKKPVASTETAAWPASDVTAATADETVTAEIEPAPALRAPGGRRPKKQGAGPAGSTNEPDDGAVPADATPEVAAPARPRPKRTRAPKIHVPATGRDGEEPVAPVAPAPEAPAGDAVEGDAVQAAEDGTNGGAATPRKRTRRGSRGGRNRRKPSVAADATAADGDAAASADEPAPAPDEAGGYVPMSEWLDDFGRSR